MFGHTCFSAPLLTCLHYTVIPAGADSKDGPSVSNMVVECVCVCAPKIVYDVKEASLCYTTVHSTFSTFVTKFKNLLLILLVPFSQKL